MARRKLGGLPGVARELSYASFTSGSSAMKRAAKRFQGTKVEHKHKATGLRPRWTFKGTRKFRGPGG